MRLIVLVLILVTPALSLEVRVGVYDNSPLVFKEGGQYKGFYVDILEEIAKKEGWEIVYVYDKFPNLLDKLKSGQIDLMTAIAYTEERAKIFEFTNETLISNWGVLVAREEVKSILELEGKRVAGVREDVYFLELQKLAKGFGIHCDFVDIVGNYKEVMDAVVAGLADTGVVSRIYAFQFSKEYGLTVTSVVFAPIELKFASTTGKKHILSAIDRNLAEMKRDTGSAYYAALEKWFGEKYEFWSSKNVLILSLTLVLLLVFGAIYFRTKAEKIAMESFEDKRFIQGVFNALQDGISVLDPNLRIVAVNHVMEKWYAKNMPLVGKKCYEAYHNRSSPCENCPTLKAIESKKVEYAVVPGLEGSRVEWLELFCYPVLDESGRVVKVVEFVRDVTEKKKAEDRLRELLDEYQYFWDSVNDVLYIHDLEGRVLRFNKKGVELAVCENENVTVWDLVEEEYHGLVREKINEIVEKREPKRLEIPVRSKNGRQHWLEVLASPVVKGSQVVAIQGIARDVTERRQLIERLEKNIQLIAHIIDRTRNSLAVARAYCELTKELGDEAIEKALKSIDETTQLLSDLDNAWLESEKLRGFLFGRKP